MFNMQLASEAPPKGLWDNDPHRFLLGQGYHDFAAVIGWDEAIRIGMLVHEQCRPPSRSRGRQFTNRGIIYVPNTYSSDCRLAEIAGELAAQKLIAALGGGTFEFSNILAANIPKQHVHIANMVREGERYAVIAALWGITERHIRRIARAHGLPPSKVRQRRKLNS
jgi:hypothetical protein